MTALGQDASEDAHVKPLALVHVIVMPDTSIRFGVELTKTGETQTEGPTAQNLQGV